MVFSRAQVNEYSPAMQCGSALQRWTSGCGPTRSTPALSIAGIHAEDIPLDLTEFAPFTLECALSGHTRVTRCF